MISSVQVRIIGKKEQESIQALLDSGAFDVVNGDVILHIQNGITQSIEIRTIPWKRKPFDTKNETVV